MEALKEAIKLKEELDELRPISPSDEKRIMQKFRLDWNYHSSNIEGNSLTYGETKALILFGTTAQGKPLKDHFEMAGHNEAINWVIDIIKGDRPLTENFIRQLHEILLKKPYEVDAITEDGTPTKKLIKVGSYKETPNHVKTQTGEIFYFATPEETPAKMNELLDWYKKDKDINPILIAAEFHYRFIRIHPFDDGNGRLARILMNFILMKHGYPPVIVKTDDKLNYFKVLRQADVGDIQPFFKYITKNLINSLQIMISGAKGESVEDKDDLDKEIALLQRMVENTNKEFGIEKSEESIKKALDNGILDFLITMIEQSKKFDSFYQNSTVTIAFNSGTVDCKPKEFKEKFDYYLSNKINPNLTRIAIVYKYNKFSKKGFGDFNHNYQVNVIFKDFEYAVNTKTNKITVNKKYSEILEPSDAEHILNEIKELHLMKIKDALSQIKK